MKPALIIILLLPFLAKGQFYNLNEDLLYSPVLLKTNNGQGSGVFVQDSSFFYFITARHNLYSIDTIKKNEKVDTVFNLKAQYGQFLFYPHNVVIDKPAVIEIDIKKANSKKLVKCHKTKDIAIIAIGFSKSNVNDSIRGVDYFSFIKKDRSTYIHASPLISRKYSDVKIGDDVFLFGFPGSIGLVENPQFDYNRPLLRKGIVSGKFEKNKTIIIDVPVFYGNSGGPVWEIYIEKDEVKTAIMGIVTEFIPYVDEWQNTKNHIVNVQTSNSNYSIVVPIEFAVDLMKEYK